MSRLFKKGDKYQILKGRVDSGIVKSGIITIINDDGVECITDWAYDTGETYNQYKMSHVGLIYYVGEPRKSVKIKSTEPRKIYF